MRYFLESLFWFTLWKPLELKMSLARWFWAFFVGDQNKRFLRQIRWRLIKMLNLFKPIEFSLSKYHKLDPMYQTSKARIWYLRKDSAWFITLHLVYRKKRSFCLILPSKALKKKSWKSTRQTHFTQELRLRDFSGVLNCIF